MSLPLATASTAEHPPAGAVTSPVDKKAKDADVDRKVRPLVRVRLTPVLISIFQLRFYGVIEAFRQGRYPSNKQIDRTLKHLLDSSPVDQSKLSPEGRKLIQDSRDVIETARLMLASRSSRHPNGLGNHSDQVGRHLQGHIYVGGFGQFDQPVIDVAGPNVRIATCDFVNNLPGTIGSVLLAN